MFRNMPFLLLLLIALACVLDPIIPMSIKSWMFSLSVMIKSFIIAILPMIIFGLLFKVMVQLSFQATKIILLLFATVCCSNFVSTFISHWVGMWIYQFDLSLIQPQSTEIIKPLWSFEFPKLIANDKAMFAGVIFGFICSIFQPKLAQKLANYLDHIVTKALQAITLIIPVFVLGFMMKLNSEGAIMTIVSDYAGVFLVIALSLVAYIAFIYWITSLNKGLFIARIKNMLPAAITGFSTMSSAAAMPMTILATEKNAQDPVLARSVIPATVNIHLIGDCFAIPILAYAILKSFALPDPTLANYLIFAGYFVLAKFSVAAVPGGGIIVMLPILESYLGFNAPMLSLITALYILFDPVITCANVMGNGGFALIIDKIRGKISRSQKELSASG